MLQLEFFLHPRDKNFPFLLLLLFLFWTFQTRIIKILLSLWPLLLLPKLIGIIWTEPEVLATVSVLPDVASAVRKWFNENSWHFTSEKFPLFYAQKKMFSFTFSIWVIHDDCSTQIIILFILFERCVKWQNTYPKIN